MTLTELLTRLRETDRDAALVFRADGAPISGGYHVTELKAAKITGIDCGGRISEWTEASLQLLDGHGGEHMKVGKFVGILEHSLKTVENLSDAPAHVEFALGNAGLRRYEMAEVGSDAAIAEVRLEETRAMCKPAEYGIRRASDPKSPKQSRCC